MGVPLTLSAVPNVNPYIQYVATNGQTVFPYPFPITQDSDLVVVVNGATLATDNGYTLSGQGNSTGGNVTFTLGQTAGAIITLFRNVAIQRVTQIGQNSGYSSTVFNAEFNQIYLILQQLQEASSFFLQIPNTNSPAPNTTLVAANYANKYLSFDANGNPAPAVLTSSGSLTQAIIASLLQPQDAAEIAAGVVPVNTVYGTQPYDIRRYGAKLDGVTDDTAAVRNALLVASQSLATGFGSAIFVPRGICMLSSMVLVPSRVRIIGLDKRGSYFKATAGWTVGNGVAAYSGATNYVQGNFATSGGILYVATQNSLNQAPPNATYWNPISPAMFYAQNGYGNVSAGVGNSMFDTTFEQCTVDASNIPGLGCVLSSALQDGSGLYSCLLLNFGTYGVRFQDFFGGADHQTMRECEIFGGTITGQTITGITKAASAVVTVNTVSTLNPFILGSYINFSGVVGMTQINGLNGNITAVGGASGAWTATVNINSSGFSNYVSGGLANNTTGVDISLPGGLAAGNVTLLDGLVLSGGSGNLGFGIACRGNSLKVSTYHPEVCTTALLLDGAGFAELNTVFAATTIGDVVQLAANHTGKATLVQVRHNGATNTLNDLRPGGYGASGAYEQSQWDIVPIAANLADAARGPAFASAWCMFDGTASGPITPGGSYNVSSVTKNAAGDYTINLTRQMLGAFAGIAVTTDMTPTAGNATGVQLQSITASQVRIQLYLNGTLTATPKICVTIFGG